jgi:hypothetical protein
MRKPIEAYRMNNHAHTFMVCHESEVRELESYNTKLEKTLEEAVELLQETLGMLPISRTDKNIRDFLKSIEQGGTDMTKTELIIRAIQDAGEPFSVEVFEKCTMVKLPIYDHNKYIEEFDEYCPDWLYDYLLTKAIEGVNRKSRKEKQSFTITSNHAFIEVYDWRWMNQGFMAYFKDVGEIKAKESALTWIYEQEQKS